jgi:membrane protein required for colicin V production
MIIDIIMLVVIVLSLYKGYRKGIIHGVIMLIGLVAGVLIALKFSEEAAWYLLEAFDWNTPFLPFISFAILFVLVLLAARLLSAVMTGFVNVVQLGILNRIGGAILALAIMLFISSTLLWFLDQSAMLGPEEKRRSYIYHSIAPIGPMVVAKASILLPFIGNTMDSIDEYNEKSSSGGGPVEI